MQIRSVVVVAALGLASFAHGQHAVQWRVEDGGNGHWYRAEPASGRTWSQWRVLAVERGGDLATVTSDEERMFVCNQVLVGLPGSTNGGNVLIGAYQEPSDPEPWGFRWVSGESFDQSWFGPGNPSDSTDFDPLGEDALAMYGPLGDAGGSPGYACAWNDVGLLATGQGALLEWSADCNGDGIVDYGQILDGTFEDANENGVPDTCEVDSCPGDINESGVVNAVDISMILSSWGTSGGKFPRTDTNQDGIVDAQDLSVVLAGWGNCP